MNNGMILNMTAFLIGFPLIMSALLLVIRHVKVQSVLVRFSSIIVICASLGFVISLLIFDGNDQLKVFISSQYTKLINELVLVAEVLMSAFIIYIGIKSKKWLIAAFALLQTAAMTIYELFFKSRELAESAIIMPDKLALIMVLLVGVIGGFICIYAVGYMKDYHSHHCELKDRRPFFFSVLFIFLAAMFGLVLFESLVWIYFCWEVTTLCSFLLIGYTKTEVANKNSLLALVMNVGGGVAFALAIIILGVKYQANGLLQLVSLVNLGDSFLLIPVFLLAFAALTKSAQLPFSRWLLGAMVSPTPVSALLHSATMVKAGVYLLIRLAPLLCANYVGIVISLVGGITFFVAALIAVSQSDAKKILAYSTISNLGLIVACAGIGTEESIWAAIMLIIFHATAKSLLFLSVGSAEHQIGSRNVEDMDGLIKASTILSVFLICGIAGMFLAPFGMLISKWAALKAFIDSKNILLVLIVVFGSSITMFFWTKWLGKLVANAHRTDIKTIRFKKDELIPLFAQTILTVLACVSFPIISKYIVIPYITGTLHLQGGSPIANDDVLIMLFMLGMLITLLLSFMPLYKRHSNTTIYMSGYTSENIEVSGKIEPQLRNWYLEKHLGEGVLLKKCIIGTGVFLSLSVVGLFIGVFIM